MSGRKTDEVNAGLVAVMVTDVGRPGGAPVPGVPTFTIEELVGQGREAAILHEGHVYRLRITANRKLILTK